MEEGIELVLYFFNLLQNKEFAIFNKALIFLRIWLRVKVKGSILNFIRVKEAPGLGISGSW